MKKFIVIILCGLFFIGCSTKPKSLPVVRVGDVSLTASEFEDLFKHSVYGIDDSAASRKDFLDNYIVRIVILKEAERLGLDKDPDFLKAVELFWQQALLKRVIERKTNELALNLKVEDREVKEYYEKHKEDFKDRAFADVYAEIKWFLVRAKQRNLLTTWIDSLKKQTKIKVDYKAINIE
jgi:peptidyl-prolyl cis-trans isomerase C